MTRILALDLSLTSTGWATTPTTYGTIVARDRRGPERMSWLRDEILNLDHTHEPELVAIEGFSYGSKGRAIIDVGGLGWVVRTSLHDAGIPYLEVAPSTIKRYATGKGNASKDLVRDAARDRFQLPAGVPSDVCDSLWLHAAVSDALGQPWIEVPKAHRAALKPVLEGLADAA